MIREGEIPIFIPSYHRADNIKTMNYFRRKGYPMEQIYVFIDDASDDIAEYEASVSEAGANLVVYSYEENARKYDYVHRAFELRRSTGQSRNAMFDYALENGIDFFMTQDDDTVRYELRQLGVRTMNAGSMTLDILRAYFAWAEYFMRKHRIGCWGYSQGGDFYGGSIDKKIIRRKVMNTTFYLMPYVYRDCRGVLDCDTFAFCGMFNEGLFTGSNGSGLILEQTLSATSKGGLTDVYQETKLLAKSLCCPIQYPSAIYAERQEMNGGRLHHRIDYKSLGPCVVKGARSNIAWDTYPEDFPFTNEPFRAVNAKTTSNSGVDGENE